VMEEQRNINGDLYVLLDKAAADADATREKVEKVVEQLDERYAKIKLVLMFVAGTSLISLLLLILTTYGVYK